MQFLYDLLGSVSDFGQTTIDFFNSIPDMFMQIMAWLNLWYIKIKLYFLIQSVKLSYATAQLLLEDIGFNEMIKLAWNALPSELRYYGHLFGVPKALTVVSNCIATSLVMRLSKI